MQAEWLEAAVTETEEADQADRAEAEGMGVEAAQIAEGGTKTTGTEDDIINQVTLYDDKEPVKTGAEAKAKVVALTVPDASEATEAKGTDELPVAPAPLAAPLPEALLPEAAQATEATGAATAATAVQKALEVKAPEAKAAEEATDMATRAKKAKAEAEAEAEVEAEAEAEVLEVAELQELQEKAELQEKEVAEIQAKMAELQVQAAAMAPAKALVENKAEAKAAEAKAAEAKAAEAKPAKAQARKSLSELSTQRPHSPPKGIARFSAHTHCAHASLITMYRRISSGLRMRSSSSISSSTAPQR